jgi:hypothetical protein
MAHARIDELDAPCLILDQTAYANTAFRASPSGSNFTSHLLSKIITGARPVPKAGHFGSPE